MKLIKFGSCALVIAFLSGNGAVAQESHADAKAQVEAHDAHHHNKAKIVGASAAGGAATGAVVGGPVGAVVGGGIGAVGGVVGNKVRKHHAVKQREKYAKPHSY